MKHLIHMYSNIPKKQILVQLMMKISDTVPKIRNPGEIYN